MTDNLQQSRHSISVKPSRSNWSAVARRQEHVTINQHEAVTKPRKDNLEFDLTNEQHLSNPALLMHRYLSCDIFTRAHTTGTVGIGADDHSKRALEFLSNSTPRGYVRKTQKSEKDARHYSCAIDS